MRFGAVLLVVCGAGVCAKIDQLFRARCAAACIQDHNKLQCESGCNLMTRTKMGACPPTDKLQWYEGACIRSCSHDTDCPGTDKCCVHDCGATCQHAVGLDHLSGLPSVPVNVTVRDVRRPRCKVVQWSASEPAGRVFYVLQERRHVGHKLDISRFGPWKGRSRRRKNRYMLTGLTPAHWYQVRVASVNSNGSRGYSAPSQAFTLNIEPRRPDEPHNLTVSRPGWVDGRLWAELRWKRPSSDLPLHHYKVFWSHCVKSDVEDDLPSNSFCKPQSVIVNHKSVNHKNTNFILKGLEPQSLYFIQVQAITIPYGSKKFSSEKAATFIDTNKHKNATYNWKIQPQHSVKGMRILNFYRTTTDKLEARVAWESSPGSFLVSWSPLSCGEITNNPTYEATTQDLQYDIHHLAFNCKYQVTVNATNSNKSAKITFKTPLCAQVSSRLPCL